MSKVTLYIKFLIKLFGSTGGLFYLISKFIAPFVAQLLLNRATLRIIGGSIQKPSESAFRLVLKAELKNTGPFRTLISYKNPLQLRAPNGSVMGTVVIKNSTSVPPHGGVIDMDSIVNISYDQVDVKSMS
jgi:hypothetical protein